MSRDYFLNFKQLSCASCTSNTQIHNLREKGQDFLFGEFKDEFAAKLAELGLEVTVLIDKLELVIIYNRCPFSETNAQLFGEL